MTYYEILGLMTETYCCMPTTATTIGVIQECAKIAYEIIQKNSPTDKGYLDVAPIVDKAIDLGIAVEQERVKKVQKSRGGGRLQDKKRTKGRANDTKETRNQRRICCPKSVAARTKTV